MLSRETARRCEDAARQWCNHQLLRDDAEKSSDANFCFEHRDVVRQQLSRCRFSQGRVAVEDAEWCTVSAVDAQLHYDTARLVQQPLGCVETAWLVRLVAGFVFRQYGHAAIFARRMEVNRMERCSALSSTAYKALHRVEKRSASRWKRGRLLSGSLLQFIPAAVAQYTVFSFLDFEQLMELRLLNHRLQPLLEAAAVAHLGRLCPSGLATIAREQGNEALRLAERARVKAEMEKESTASGSRKSGKTKRARDSPASADAALRSTPALSPATSSSSSSPFSPASPLHASYTMGHCVWAMQQLQWCGRLNRNGYRGVRPMGERVLTSAAFLFRFPLPHAWARRFPAIPGSDEPQLIVDVLDMLLGEYGGVVEASGQLRWSRSNGLRRGGPRDHLTHATSAGCPTLLSTNGRLRCARCRQIRASGYSAVAVDRLL